MKTNLRLDDETLSAVKNNLERLLDMNITNPLLVKQLVLACLVPTLKGEVTREELEVVLGGPFEEAEARDAFQERLTFYTKKYVGNLLDKLNKGLDTSSQLHISTRTKEPPKILAVGDDPNVFHFDFPSEPNTSSKGFSDAPMVGAVSTPNSSLGSLGNAVPDEHCAQALDAQRFTGDVYTEIPGVDLDLD